MTTDASEATAALSRLMEVMRRLRDPLDGCPWDLMQTHATIAPYTIEEAYETEDAIARGDITDLRDELGDLLLQVIFQAQIGHEAGDFDFADIANAIATKMIRRHPHIFGDDPNRDPASGPVLWEEIKAAERREKAGDAPESALDGVAATLPPVARAEKLQRRAARIGFDFPDWRSALAKTHEELLEVIKSEPEGGQATKEEIGDLLFSTINLARKLEVDADAALKAANTKFERRFQSMERALAAAGVDPKSASLPQQDAAWDAAKDAEALLRK
ncbi:MAG: nucleoside triphosphate pyrophosphohydrolase [Alphaproteobacteria bacterium]